MQFGIDRLLTETSLKKRLKKQRLALLAHPASMTSDFVHSLDAIAACDELNLCVAFGPQHGLRGDKQDNMVETKDEFDSKHAIPVYSLYGKVRRPTEEMLNQFDVLLFDIQDIGCRIYTFISTLFYLLEDCARTHKSLWVLDRPNPAGRPIEGFTLLEGQESFVGAAPIPMRHGLTLGEAARWYVDFKQLDIDLEIITMQDYHIEKSPGLGWHLNEFPWVNPSPNIATLNAARCYAGTVILEGTTLSEGRGTTRPLELFGASDLDIPALLETMQNLAPDWLAGCRLRETWFEPTFHKYQGQLCAGLQIHTDYPDYQHEQFKPFRLLLLFLKSLRLQQPDYPIWRNFPYEYELNRLAIDVINGGTGLRDWVDNPDTSPASLEKQLLKDEQTWQLSTSSYHLY